MQFPQIFEGPLLTLFLFEGYYVRIINDEGDEALLPLADFRGLLLHLASHASTLLSDPEAAEWLVRQLSRHDHHA